MKQGHTELLDLQPGHLTCVCHIHSLSVCVCLFAYVIVYVAMVSAGSECVSVRTARHLVWHGRDALQHCIHAVNLSRISNTLTAATILLIKRTLCGLIS